ncbi:hypothetical protein HK100_007086 [Physocladia obscura]|uniref:CRAL-TRIO domain-containing protein n=1 Tax=Physocladia obscura TaxID=109957 RepID=A0AAD5T577_9FUNG|nr:hypothetical protein HK100_007086 [Physocladia obscura]
MVTFEPVFTHPAANTLALDFPDSLYSVDQLATVTSVAQLVPSLIASLTNSDTDANAAYAPRLAAWADRACVRRYLASYLWNVPEAIAKLKASLQWRLEVKPDLIDPAEVEPEAESGKGFITGFDKKGHPVAYASQRLDNTATYDRCLRFTFFIIEKALKLTPKGIEKISIILDNEGVGVFNAPPISFIIQFQGIAQFSKTKSPRTSHYPGCLESCIIANPGWILWGLYSVVSSYLDPAVKEKIFFVSYTPVVPAAAESAAAPVVSSAGGWGSYFGLTSSTPTPEAAAAPADAKAVDSGSWSSFFGGLIGAGGESAAAASSEENTTGTGGWVSLDSLIDAEFLPSAFGGKFDFEYNHKVYWERISAI